MATGTAEWTENQQDVNFDDTTPADGVTSVANFDLDANGYDRIVVQLQIDWNVAATDYADIFVYSSPDSGVSLDSVPIWSQRLDVDNDPENISIIIEGVPYVQIAFDNQSNQEVTDLDLIYAGRKWDIT